ncbi:MAG TPA: glycosyl hydrolase family 8 [Polyangiaceae bacterium]|nr:glycosyl hydrolase family 8 [Polyangiaceae bacterium]
MRKRFLCFLVPSLLLATGCVKKPGSEPAEIPETTRAGEAHVPFGSRPHPYAEGSILPSASPAERDQAVKDFYDFWSKKYLAPGCNPGELVVNSKTKPTNLTVSEAHGYGMIILAYMAGHDPEAKTRFDAMIRYHREHLSAITSGIMAWYQNSACNDIGGDNGATDGDLDIAYGLLLADKQWGSCGDVNYRAHAEWVIAAISRRGIDGQGRYPILGDWVTPSDAHYFGARVSDFMGTHFRAFQTVSKDAVWGGLLPNTYWIADTLQRRFAPETGLLPDFAEDLRTDNPRPAHKGFLEGARDSSYAYNACRIPLRMGTDFLLSGDARPRAIAQRLNNFAEKVSGGDPKQLRGGYHLDGTQMVDYETMAFTGPFAVGAMTDPTKQEWLDKLWTHSVTREAENYYEDTLRMLSLIALSGNWWGPEKVKSACPALPAAQ